MQAFLVHSYGSVWVLTPYEPDFIEELKDRIPYRSRSWEKDAKAWRVSEPYVRDACRLVRGWFEPVLEAGHTAPATPSLSEVARQYPHHATLEVWPTASETVIRAAYRALVQLHHPDHAGAAGEGRTKALNTAYAALGLRQTG